MVSVNVTVSVNVYLVVCILLVCALTELSLPQDVNIFYAVDLRSSLPLELVVRRNADLWWRRPSSQDLRQYNS